MHRHLKQHGWAIAIATLVAACSSDNGDQGGSAPAPSAGTTGATAGKTGSTAGTSATAGKTGSTAGTGTTLPVAGKTGSTANGSTATAGHSGSGAAGVGDEDAGVPTAGSHAAGSGAAGSHAGNGGTGTAAGSGGGSASAASFTQVYSLFMTSCAGATCHVGATRPAAGLDMKDKATAYMNLVGADAMQCMGEKRVVAGDSDKSELVHTLQHTNIGSCRNTPKMPDNKPMFTAAQLDTVIGWVKAGAPDN